MINIENVSLSTHSFSHFNPNLKKIIISEKNRFHSIYEEVLYNKNFSNIILAPSNIVTMKIHENVNVIDKYACAVLCNLTFVELPKNLAIIDSDGFSYCESLKTNNFPETLISINYNGFYKCTSLEELKFQPNLETICSYAFGNCKSLKSVDIPDSLMDL